MFSPGIITMLWRISLLLYIFNMYILYILHPDKLYMHIFVYMFFYMSTDSSSNMTLTFFEIQGNTKIWPFPMILRDGPFSEREWRVNVRWLTHSILERLTRKHSTTHRFSGWDTMIPELTLVWDCSYGDMKVYFHGQWLGQNAGQWSARLTFWMSLQRFSRMI